MFCCLCPIHSYFALNAISILLIILRLLKLMDFQPRLGVITKAIWRASSDLFYFLIVAALVFLFYAMFAHIILGDALKVWMVHAVIVCVGPHTAVIL